MNTYMTEEEQIEAIKKWWTKYGSHLMTILLICIIGVVAFQWWQKHALKIRGLASSSYEQMMVDMTEDDFSGVEAQANHLLSNYPNTVYGSVVALVQAKQAVDKGVIEEAKVKLQWVIENTSVKVYKQIAQLRLARVLAQQKEFKRGLAVLEDVNDKAFLPSIYEVRGDIYLLEGKSSQAKENYLLAEKLFPKTGLANPLLRMKLNELSSATVVDGRVSEPVKSSLS